MQRHWFRYRLSSLLIVIFAVAIVLAFWRAYVDGRRRALCELYRSSAYVDFEWDRISRGPEDDTHWTYPLADEGLRHSYSGKRPQELAIDDVLAIEVWKSALWVNFPIENDIDPCGQWFSLHQIGWLPEIRHLSMWGAPCDDLDFAHVRALRSLQHLNVAFTDVTTLLPLSHCPQLRFVDAVGTRITDDGLEGLESCSDLEWLRLDACPIRGPGLKNLEKCQKLRVISLNGTDVNDEGMRSVGKIPALEFLFLDDTRVTDAGITHLRTSKKLKLLWLNGTNVSSASSPVFIKLAQEGDLRSVHVAETNFSKADWKRLDVTLRSVPRPEQKEATSPWFSKRDVGSTERERAQLVRTKLRERRSRGCAGTAP